MSGVVPPLPPLPADLARCADRRVEVCTAMVEAAIERLGINALPAAAIGAIRDAVYAAAADGARCWQNRFAGGPVPDRPEDEITPALSPRAKRREHSR